MPLKQDTSYLHWVQCAHVIAQLGFFSSFVFCYILIFLTLFGVKRNFGSYKYLVLIFPIVGIFFATIEFILYPHVHSYNAGYLFYSTSRPFNISADSVTWCLAFYTGIYASTISMLSVQFLYRYWAVFDESKLMYFKGWRFLISIAYSSFFGFQWAFGIYYFDRIDDYAASYMRIEMLTRYGIDTDDVAGMSLVAYDANGDYRWFNLSCTINMTTIMLIQYIVIIYCAATMYREMEEKLQMVSDSMKTLHKQFFKTLLLQICTPTVTLFSPVILIIYLPLLDINVNLPTGVFLCAFTLYPAMDAIIIMYIVTDYRKAAKKLLKKFLDCIYECLNLGAVDSTSHATRSGDRDRRVQAPASLTS